MKLLVFFAFCIFSGLVYIDVNDSYDVYDSQSYEVYHSGREALGFEGVSLAPAASNSRLTFTLGSVSGRLCAADQSGNCDLMGYIQVMIDGVIWKD